METVGNIAGPLLGYEVLTAFFLEAGFLGVMLFGHGRVTERVHFLSTFFVAFGTTLSAFWILALNSWMQTPTGHQIVDGMYHVKSWVDVIFNPSFPYRFTHMLLASALTCAFLLAGLSAWQLLRGVRPALGAARAARRPHAGGAGHPAAGRRSAIARPEHARAPAGQDRRDRGRVEHRARRTAVAVRGGLTRPSAGTTSRSRCPSSRA